MENHKHTNSLISASSPYLLQHAHNPVDWFEWGEEAFTKARAEDKLVLISIGYSACHWCHVMEHECFEKEDTAALMNEHFVCIKVDREERPDIDQIYMDAVQLLTGRGGWPLNCFALPDGRPIHGGTYFPKSEWESLLKSLSGFYRSNKEEALKYATELTNGIKQLNFIEKNDHDELSIEVINLLIEKRKTDFDTEYGGFAWAPKFPMPVNLELFLQQHYYTKDEELLNAVYTTLTKMAEGGIYDQVGGGFARYSVDAYWKVPHFEKMLYDNAQLVSVYCQAYQMGKNELYKKVVLQTLEYINRELTAKEGVFYSALDADSEGIEGKFYVWQKKELQDILGEDEPLYSLVFSVDAYGNWEHGNNILYKTRTNEELVDLTGRAWNDIEAIIKKCNEKLLQHRSSRVRPGLDNKTICSWNALMIKAYADAYLTFGDETYLQSAVKAADFIMTNMWHEDKLFRIYKDGRLSIPGFADDYALTCEALIRLFEASTDDKYLIFAKEIMDTCLANFHDEEKGVFHFKSKEGEQLVSTKPDLNDDVIPASNSVLAKCMLILSYLFDENEYLRKANNMLQIMGERIQKYPANYSNWQQVYLLRHHGLTQIIISGGDVRKNLLLLCEDYLPNKVFAVVTPASAIPLLKEKPVQEETVFYVCKDKMCGLPVKSVAEVIKQA